MAGKASIAASDGARPHDIGPPLGLDHSKRFDHLPPPNTKRWVVRRKAEVLTAIRSGQLSRAEACARYLISEEELGFWERAIDCVGIPGLRVTRVQVYRPVFDGTDRLKK